jgi:hypothetical protein
MILFKKMDILRPLLPAAMIMRFSNEAEKRRLSLSAQKAVWATSIINKISSPSPLLSIKNPSLRDEIINLPDPSIDFDFDKEAKK